MSRHARIEEVEDSDPEESDLSQLTDKPFFDPTARVPASQFNNREPGESSSSFAQPAASWPPPPTAPVPSSSRPSGPTGSSVLPPPYPADEAHKRGRVGAANLPWAGNSNTQYVAASQASTYKHYQSLYPIYFDITRSRQGGRKVPKSHAVENPLAREIVDACALLGLKVVFEPGKTHPKDWANPGRVRVLLKGEDGLPMVPGVQNKFVLLLKVGEYLKANPATAETPLKLRMAGIPFDPAKPPQPNAAPRGWKLNQILPLHSPALSGGGVSEDIFKEMMAGMGMGDAFGGAGSSTSTVKEKGEGKKKKKR